jgi:hypothetical protein
MSFLQHLLTYRESNQLTPEKLISYFTDALTHFTTVLEKQVLQAINESEREKIMKTAHMRRAHRQGFLSLFLM